MTIPLDDHGLSLPAERRPEPRFVFDVRGRHLDSDGETIWVWLRLLSRNREQSLPELGQYSTGTLAMTNEDFRLLKLYLDTGRNDMIVIRENK